MAVDNKAIAHWRSADIATTLEAFANYPQIVPDLREAMGQGIYMTDMISMMKNDNNFVASESWSAAERNPIFRTMTIGNTVTGGASAGASITFNLAAGDVDQYHHSYPRAGTRFIVGSAQNPREFEILTVTPTGGADGATIVAYQVNSTEATAITPNAYIGAGKTFMLKPAVNAAPGTAGTTPTLTGFTDFTFYTSILKDAKGWENGEFARMKWFPVLEGQKMYSDEIAHIDADLDMAMEVALWVGAKNTNTSNIVQTSLATGGSVVNPGTVGVWNHILDRGYKLDYNNTTDFTMEHFYELKEYGQSVGLPSGKWMFSHGGALGTRIEKSCKGYFTNNTGSLTDMFLADAGGGYKNFSIGFKTIQIGGQVITLHPNSLFSNPLMLGISSYGFDDAAAFFPLMDVTTRDGRVPNLSIKYRGLGGYNRKRAIAPFRGVAGPDFAGPVVLEGDISKIHATTEFGVEFLEAWRGGVVYNTDITNAV